MASHMSTLGFTAKDREAFADLAMRAVREGTRITLPDGSAYVQWATGGAQLWVQLAASGQIIGLNPHFSGPTRMSVGLTQRITHPDDNALDGSFYGWAGAQDTPDDGEFPFVFDAPDYRTHDGLQLPTLANVQLAAFAHSLQTFSDDQAFAASGTHMAAESCIPSGLFSPQGQPKEPPKAEIIFYGHVLETIIYINAITSLPFHWARVKTLGGELDVVADPSIVQGVIVKDGVIGGNAWLSGRVV